MITISVPVFVRTKFCYISASQYPVCNNVFFFIGSSICLYVDGHVVFYLCNCWNAIVWKYHLGSWNFHRKTQQFQAHLSVSYVIVQVSYFYMNCYVTILQYILSDWHFRIHYVFIFIIDVPLVKLGLISC